MDDFKFPNIDVDHHHHNNNDNDGGLLHLHHPYHHAYHGDMEEVLVPAQTNPRLANGVVVAVLMVIGLVGNGLVLYVYHVKMPRTVFSTFITVLALLDMATVMLGMPIDVAIKTCLLNRSEIFNTICKVAHFEVYSTSLASGSVLLLIAVSRYNKVCRPMQPGISRQQARMLSFLILGVAMILCTVSFVINGMEKVKIAVGEGYYPKENSSSPSAFATSTNVTGKLTDLDNGGVEAFSPSWTNASHNLTHSYTTASPEYRASKTVAGFPFSPRKEGPRNTTFGEQRGQKIYAPLSETRPSGANEDDILDDVGEALEVEGSKQRYYDNNNKTEDEGGGGDEVKKVVVMVKRREVVEVYICRTSEEQKGTVLYNALQAVLMLAFSGIFLSLIVLHCRISRAVRQFERRQSTLRRASVHSDGEQQHSITASMFRIFVSITAIFVLSYLPHLVCLIVAKSLFGPHDAMPQAIRVVVDLAYNFPYINVVTNPFIYGYRSQVFRQHCWQLLRRCCRRCCCCCCWCRNRCFR